MDNNLIKIFTDFWELIVLVIGGIGGVLGYFNKRQSSTSLLYKQLEELKIQVIAQVQRDIQLTNKVAEREKIINELKLHCKDCYEKIIQQNE